MLKKTNKFGIGKFLVMALVLGGGLIYGTQMVQKNQENRSSAAAPVVICKCSNPKYGNAYNCAKNKGKWSCTSAKSTPTPVKKPTVTPVRKNTSGGCDSYYDEKSCNSNGCVWYSNYSKCSPKDYLNCELSGKLIINSDTACVKNKIYGYRLVRCINGKISTIGNYQDDSCENKEVVKY